MALSCWLTLEWQPPWSVVERGAISKCPATLLWEPHAGWPLKSWSKQKGMHAPPAFMWLHGYPACQIPVQPIALCLYNFSMQSNAYCLCALCQGEMLLELMLPNQCVKT